MMMLLLVAGAAPLVAPGARPPRAVVSGGAAYDYCVQALGCTTQEATKAEGALLPNIAESMTRTQIDCVCDWLQSSLDLSDAELKKVVMRFPALLGYSVEDNMAPKLDWLQTRLELDEAQLRKMVLTLPTLLSYSVETNMAPKLAYLERETGLSRSELRDRVLRFPQFMSYSLEKRYRPRLEACRAAGVDAEYVLTYVSKMDEKFYELLEKKKDAVGETM